MTRLEATNRRASMDKRIRFVMPPEGRFVQGFRDVDGSYGLSCPCIADDNITNWFSLAGSTTDAWCLQMRERLDRPRLLLSLIESSS